MGSDESVRIGDVSFVISSKLIVAAGAARRIQRNATGGCWLRISGLVGGAKCVRAACLFFLGSGWFCVAFLLVNACKTAESRHAAC